MSTQLASRAKYQKTSVQLNPQTLRRMDKWHGLTRSEAIRICVERGSYMSTLKAQEISDLAYTYRPILRGALADLGYDDYKIVARVLPEIVERYVTEASLAGYSWNHEGTGAELKPDELVKKLYELHPTDRIGVLDCTVAARYQIEDEENKDAGKPARNRERR
ncbi:MAG: hypothetical protein LAQ69_43970 [Acidobacteriia bacterium]|nr:hypothetical protein [Terriglobia bacterium]